MRTRSKSNVLSLVTVPTWLQRYTPPGPPDHTVPAFANLIREQDVEYMSDEPDKAHRFKTVMHQKRKFSAQLGSGNWFTSGGVLYEDVSGVAGSYWVTWWGNFQFLSWENLITTFDKTDDTLMRETMDAFYNVNEVDTLLNVVEAPELVTSLAPLYKTFKEAINLPPFQATRREILRRFRRYTSFISGGFLYYKFGIAPILHDMKKISTNLRRYRQRLDNVLKNAGREISVHKGCGGQFGGLYDRYTINHLPLGYATGHDLGGAWTTTPYVQVCRKICTIRGIRDIRYNSKSFQTLDFLASRFGATGPASFVWERIPFSFVVDWFLDLSGVINSIDNALTGSSKKITGASISEKVGYLCPISHVRPGPTVTSSRDGNQIALLELSSYIRKATAPTVSVGFSGRFGKNQYGITAALISQMAAKLKAKR